MSQNNDESKSNEDVNSESEAVSFSSLVGTTITGTTAINIGTAVTAGASAQGIVSVAGQGQLLMLLPEVGADMPALVNETFSNLDSLMLSFDFLPLDSNPVHDKFEETFGYSKNKRDLSIIKNGSSILNLFNFLVVLILIVMFNFIVQLLRI